MATAARGDGGDGGTSVVMTRCSICHFVNPANGPTHNARTCPLRQTQCRRSLPEGHPFYEPGQCVSAACIHKQKCNTCGLFGHLYGTQALTVERWRFNKKGRLVRKPTKRALCKDDFVCALMTDVSIQSMVDNSVSVATAAAQDAHTRRVATSRLRGNTNVERLDIDETIDVMEELNSDAAVLQKENKTQIKTLYKNLHLGVVAANRLAASAAESSLDEATPSTSDSENRGILSTSSGSEAAAAAAGARRSRGRGRTPRGSGGRGTGRSGGSGSGGGGSGGGSGGGGGGSGGGSGSGKKKLELKSTRVHHAGRQSRTDRYAAAVAKGQRASPSKRGGARKSKDTVRKGSMGTAPIDVDDLDVNDGSAAVNDGWPAGTRARFETRLPEFYSPRFGGNPPTRIAHAVIVQLYQCPIEEVDAEMAGVVVKGASDSQLRGYMLTPGTLSAAQVAEWLCSAMGSALRCATLPSMAMALERVVNAAAAEAANASGFGGPPAVDSRAAARPLACAAPYGGGSLPAAAADATAVPPVLPVATVVSTLPAVPPAAAGSTPASPGVPTAAAKTPVATCGAGARSS